MTSALHMPRAVRLFERQGLRVIPAPTDFLGIEADWAHFTQPDLGIQTLNLWPSADNLMGTSWAIREYIGC